VKKHKLKILILLLLCTSTLSAQTPEYEVKAVFLERFTRFIEWPADSSISDTSTPFIIGVMGDNPFDHILEELYKNYKIKNKNVRIKYFSTPEQITECNLLYISESEKDKLNSILEKINNKPILAVSDSDGFAEEGIHINLYVKNNKVRYEINESTLTKSGFTAWAQLLSSAKIVNPVEKK